MDTTTTTTPCNVCDDYATVDPYGTGRDHRACINRSHHHYTAVWLYTRPDNDGYEEDWASFDNAADAERYALAYTRDRDNGWTVTPAANYCAVIDMPLEQTDDNYDEYTAVLYDAIYNPGSFRVLREWGTRPN